MRHPNPDVRWRAALVLGGLGDPRAIPALSRALRDPEVLVHRTAAESLVQIGGPGAASALTRVLGDSRPSLVNAAMNGLQQMGETAVTPLMIALYSEDAQTQHNAATVLGYIGSPRAVPALEYAAHDAEPEVQEEAKWALEQIAKRSKKG